jgi:amidase
VPAGRTEDGLPIGAQLVAAPGREDLLIRVAAQVERPFPLPGR